MPKSSIDVEGLLHYIIFMRVCFVDCNAQQAAYNGGYIGCRVLLDHGLTFSGVTAREAQEGHFAIFGEMSQIFTNFGVFWGNFVIFTEKYIKPIMKISAVNIIWGPNRPQNAVLGLNRNQSRSFDAAKPWFLTQMIIWVGKESVAAICVTSIVDRMHIFHQCVLAVHVYT